jgi:hypothetical protein
MKLKLSSPSGFRQLMTLILTSAAAFLLTSCSTVEPKREVMSEAEACSEVNKLIEAHPSEFAGYKKNKRFTRRMTIWDATMQFPNADNCQVWEWSNGLDNYYCEWKADDEKDAQADFHKAEGILEQCLGPQWTRHKNPTTSGGEHTRFSKEGSKTIVSIRYFKDEYWQTALYIGDKSNLNTPIQ